MEEEKRREAGSHGGGETASRGERRLRQGQAEESSDGRSASPGLQRPQCAPAARGVRGT